MSLGITYHDDCLALMPTLEADSIDAIVTDPPYGLERSGRGYMDHDWDSTGIAFQPQTWFEMIRLAKPGAYLLAFGGRRTVHRMTCAIEDAGWIIRDVLVWAYWTGMPHGPTTLKPAWEPIVLARKPGPLQTLGIDAARIGDEVIRTWSSEGIKEHVGRWPANVIVTDDVLGGGVTAIFIVGKAKDEDREPVMPGVMERRPFARSDGARAAIARGEEYQTLGTTNAGLNRVNMRANTHGAAKPLALMRHLVRLVVPEGGIVLDPFAGSGTTLLAADQEGRQWVGIEKEREYVDIIEGRLKGHQRGMGL